MASARRVLLRELNTNFEAFLDDNHAATEWLLNNRLITPPICCNRPTSLQRYQKFNDGYYFRCRDRDCKNVFSLKRGNLLHGSRLSMGEICYIIFYCFPRQFCFQEIHRRTGACAESIRKLRRKYWTLLRYHYEAQPRLGRLNQTVEIDESKFNRTNNRGRFRRMGWVFGMIERGENGRFKLFVVPDRTSATLIPLITRNIDVNCTALLSDMFRSYNPLRTLGYEHYMVNHSRNFVDPNAAFVVPPNRRRLRRQIANFPVIVHTQTIENLWGRIKRRLRRRGGLNRLWLQEMIWESQFYLENSANLDNAVINLVITYVDLLVE